MKEASARFLYRGTSLSLIIRVGGVALLFVANLLLARSMPQADYGLFAYTIELIALSSVIAALGFDQIAIREVPDRLAGNDRSGLARFIVFGLSAIAASSLVIGGLLYIGRLSGAMPPSMTNSMLALAVIGLAALSSLRLAQETMRAAKRIGLSQVVEQLAWPVLLMAAGVALAAGWFAASVPALLVLQIALFFGSAALLFRKVLDLVSTNGPRAMPAGGLARWLGAGVPLAFAASLSVLLNRGDIVALGTVLTAEQLAPYTAASRYAAFLVLGLAAASAATAGVMRDAWRDGDQIELQHTVSRATGLATVFAVPVALVFILFPEAMLSLYGPGFVAGSGPLILLVLAQLLNALTGPVALIVIVCDLGKAYTVAMAGAVVLFAVTLSVLVPRAGANGAAMSVLIALSALNLSLAAVIYQRTGIRAWITPRGFADALRDLSGIIISRWRTA
ncbi:oligosaccharide flippase family protein [Tsuneonella sp. HG249]